MSAHPVRGRRRSRRSIAVTLGATLVAVLAVGVVASGCSATTDSAPSPPANESSPSAEPTATSTGPAPLDRLTLTLEPIARGLEQPVFVTAAGDDSGRLFVVEQTGRVRVLRGGKLADGAFLDVSRRISSGGERGLLGLAFAPDYGKSGTFYVNYTDTGGDTVVARFVADDPASDAPSLRGPDEVLRVAQPYSNHNGGCIVFGPDGRLWVGMGDGGSAGDPEGNAQDPTSRLGKMLALSLPQGRGRATVEVVQSGLRNPWRFSFDRDTDDLWIGDVGQNAWEEIDLVPFKEATGVNWGWNLWEGTHPYPFGAQPTQEGFSFPVAEYGHDEGTSVTGGYVYRGSDSPALVGTYLYADFVAGWVAGLRAPARRPGELRPTQLARGRVLIERAGNPSSFGEDEAGELYLCDYGGTIFRISGAAE